jgi:hypothetical protein
MADSVCDRSVGVRTTSAPMAAAARTTSPYRTGNWETQDRTDRL